MIEYSHHLFGLKSIRRVHGSAVSKAILPSLFSTGILLTAIYGFDISIEDNDILRQVTHPYSTQVFIAFVTFLITFRANMAYGRYWEAATATYQMLSKWLDSCVTVAAFHYQSSKYTKTAPPSFADNPERQDFITRTRIAKPSLTLDEYKEQLLSQMKLQESALGTSVLGMIHFLTNKKQKEKKKGASKKQRWQSFLKSISSVHEGDSTRLQESLAAPFLEEAVHLFSLLSAVAMSTLREDIPGVEAPLVRYVPGIPFPPKDPDQLPKAVRNTYDESSRFWTGLYFIFGLSRSDRRRTLYNQARPFRVLGGVSDREVQALRQARGPVAKVSLCFMWVQEFICREQINGGMGHMHDAIISRCFQFASDGMKGYHECRKVAYIPFPFVSSQINVVFLTVIVWCFPLMFFSFVNSVILACLLNFSTVLCFYGLHEVARELEDPFKNIPNNIPLTTYQAEFNEALITTWAGFHPDLEEMSQELPDIFEETEEDIVHSVSVKAIVVDVEDDIVGVGETIQKDEAETPGK